MYEHRKQLGLGFAGGRKCKCRRRRYCLAAEWKCGYEASRKVGEAKGRKAFKALKASKATWESRVKTFSCPVLSLASAACV
jgi:hypothetical protein